MVGGGVWQVPLVLAAKKLGCFVVCTNPYKDSPGFAPADVGLMIDIRNKEKQLKAARRYRVDAVVSDQVDLAVPTVADLAEKLGLHLSEVYGVISFYSFFTTKPLGKHQISVCTGTACFVRGSGKVLDEFKRYLTVSEGETTADGKFSLGALRCVGACSLAPVVMVNGRVYGNVTPKKVAEILSECN